MMTLPSLILSLLCFTLFIDSDMALSIIIDRHFPNTRGGLAAGAFLLAFWKEMIVIIGITVCGEFSCFS